MTGCRLPIAVAIVLLANGACRREPPQRSAAAARSGAAVATTPQDTGFAGTTAPIDRMGGRRTGRPMLHAVEAGPGQGYDRVVFTFTLDSLPGYHVEYARGPVRRCGSGDPVSVAGSERLVVRFAPAQAHDEQGHPLLADRERVPGLPAVKELKLVCDFEGEVAWVLGVAAVAPYRVSELARPARLVLDVRRTP